MALALVLCLGSALAALAASYVDGGTESNYAKITLKKTLNLSSNLTEPTAAFRYTLTPVKIDDDDSQPTKNTMPAISITDVTFGGDAVTSTAGGINTYSKESVAFPANTVTFPRAGVYTYTLAEMTNTYSVGTGETMTYDSTTYIIKLFVKNGTSGCYVFGAEAWTVDVGTGNPIAKIDPTPGSSVMEFVSNFSKTTIGEDPTSVGNKLFLSKGVTGDYADKSLYFSFVVMVTAPTSAPANTTYKAYVVDDTNTVVTAAANYSGTVEDDMNYGKYIKFTSGSDETVKLKHNQKLVFTELPIGTFYEMKEMATPDYKGSVQLYQGSSVPSAVTASIPNLALSSNEANGNAEASVFENPQNGVMFTNEHTATITPTGIIIDNLPFILLLIVAMAGLALFVVVKARKRRGYASR